MDRLAHYIDCAVFFYSLGVVSEVSLAGAINTGYHGSGIKYNILSQYVSVKGEIFFLIKSMFSSLTFFCNWLLPFTNFHFVPYALTSGDRD